MRFVKNVGLGFKTPKTAREGNYVDKKCPFTGDVSIRGRILKARGVLCVYVCVCADAKAGVDSILYVKKSKRSILFFCSLVGSLPCVACCIIICVFCTLERTVAAATAAAAARRPSRPQV